MKRYAMVLLERVIGIIEAEAPPSWPPDPHGNPVTTVECDNTVELEMIYDSETGKFTDYVPPAYIPTSAERIEEAVDAGNKNSLIIMEAIADQYEQNLNNRLNDMEVQATIYEAVLALGEGGAAV